jgi:hypothetical protein
MQLLIDRLRPFIASGGLRGEQAVLVAPSEEGEPCCGPFVESFRRSLSYLGMTYGGSVLARAYEKGEVADARRSWRKPRRSGRRFAWRERAASRIGNMKRRWTTLAGELREAFAYRCRLLTP